MPARVDQHFGFLAHRNRSDRGVALADPMHEERHGRAPNLAGHLRLSLVTCPVALYTATSPGGDVHFNLCQGDPQPIRMIPTDPDKGPSSAPTGQGL